MEFITDRSYSHVARLKKLRSIGWKNMTDSQKAEYTGYASKGAYNYTDLNRVESAVAELSKILGLTLSTRTTWNMRGAPYQADMRRYLNNVKAIRDACPGNIEFPPLPDSMDKLTIEGANNIEKVLELVYQTVNS